MDFGEKKRDFVSMNTIDNIIIPPKMLAPTKILVLLFWWVYLDLQKEYLSYFEIED